MIDARGKLKTLSLDKTPFEKMKKGNEERNSKGDLLNPNPEMVAFIRQSHVRHIQVGNEESKKISKVVGKIVILGS